MKKLSKVISSLILVVALGGVISLSLVNPKNKNLNIKNLNNEKLAVFIKQSDGSYKTSANIPQSGYQLNTDKSTCSNGAKPTWSNNTLNLANLTSENTNCYLYFDEYEATKTLNKLGLTAKTETPDFSQAATTDEGIYAVEDGMYGGTSYYWRGAVTTNHVIFANKCWRIVRINGDGTIRLIYNGTVSSGTCTGNGSNSGSVVMGSTDAEKRYATSDGLYNNSSYVGWTYTLSSQRPTLSKDENGLTVGGTESNAKVQTEKWFNNNITGTNVDKVVAGKFCNDRSVGRGSYSATDSNFYYGGYSRFYTSITPTLDCPEGDVYELKVGAITSDEVMYAGGLTTNNTSYYLYNGQAYWSMTSTCWTNNAQVFFVMNNGNLNNTHVGVVYIGLRPVINLDKDTLFKSGGNGTLDKPYVVEGAE